MAKHPGPVLVDTNVILESYRVGAWRALAGGYPIETVEDCITETQTGFQRRRPEQLIDPGELRASMATVHGVDDRELAALLLQAADIALDTGEQSLWAHALGRSDGWILCGPDKASLRFGVRSGFRDRLFALEHLLEAVGHRPKQPLKTAYTSKWLAKTLSELVISEGI
ncbi:hypothetical protein ACW9UR_06790 [Halovulum sp. GXIMD14794]